MEFKKYKISDVAKVIGGGTPSTRKTEYYGSEISWITPKDLSNHKKRYIAYGERSITNLGLQKSSAKLLPTNTVLFTSRAPIGYVAIAENQVSTNQGFKSLVCNENIILPEYMYYLMKFSTPELESLATGSTFKEVSGSIVKNFEIELPNIFGQEKIINILSSLDSKIELNLDIIHNLEQLSQILFKHWFIDFEFPNEEGKPYKSSGGEMVESELGNIPKNWTFSYFSNYVKQTLGGDWGKENIEKNYVEQVSIIRGADIPELIKGSDNKVPTRFILKKNYENKKLLLGDIVIEISGGSPTQSTGRSIFINKNIISRYNGKILCTNFCRIIRPVDFNRGIWLQMYINYLYKKNVFFNFENGTTGIKNLDLNAILNKYKIFSPSEDIIHLFSERMEVILDSIQNLGMEIKRLENIRDTLLPKLLSGEIEIPDDLEV